MNNITSLEHSVPASVILLRENSTLRTFIVVTFKYPPTSTVGSFMVKLHSELAYSGTFFHGKFDNGTYRVRPHIMQACNRARNQALQMTHSAAAAALRRKAGAEGGADDYGFASTPCYILPRVTLGT